MYGTEGVGARRLWDVKAFSEQEVSLSASEEASS